jgi:hypothetical protein
MCHAGLADDSRANVFESLRKQYVKRRPRRNPLGTEDAPVEWAQLGLGNKVGILWQLCEWQMEDPAKFRGLLKSEEDAASWVCRLRSNADGSVSIQSGGTRMAIRISCLTVSLL